MPSMEEFRALSKRVSNWGRWGKDDERGALNFITDETLKRASASVGQGKLFSLGMEFGIRGPQTGNIGRFNPHHYMTAIDARLGKPELRFGYADDVIHMPLQCATQWDALSHVHYEGLLYNGFKVEDELSLHGAAKLGVEKMAKPGILSRGILLDVARLKGVERLGPDMAVTPDDLEAACRAQNVAPKSGDIVLVRTGYIEPFVRTRDHSTLSAGHPGLTMECAEWIHAHELAAVCADNAAVEHMPMDPDLPLPLHMLCIRDMGCTFGEFFDLGALAADCAADGQYTFLLAAPALGVTRGVGSPVNPLALK